MNGQPLPTTLEALLQNPCVKDVISRAHASNHSPMPVGGMVRDALLGRPFSYDQDFLVPEGAYDLALLLAEEKGTRVVWMGKPPRVAFRVPIEEGYLDLVEPQGSLVNDLKRRDYSINALLVDPKTHRLFDAQNGLMDLETKHLRCSTRQNILDDPLRILRGFRFLVVLDEFQVGKETEGWWREFARLVPHAAPERVGAEMIQILGAPKVAGVIGRMDNLGILSAILPESDPLRGLAQNPKHHHLDVWSHTLSALMEFETFPKELQLEGFPPLTSGTLALMRLALLCHDLGKAKTRTVDEKGQIHFYAHQRDSARLAKQVCHRWRLSRKVSQVVEKLCLHHLRPLGLSVEAKPGPSAFRRLVRDMGPHLPLLIRLVLADKAASLGQSHSKGWPRLQKTISKLWEAYCQWGEELARIKPMVGGEEAMEVLGIGPGPLLGKALDVLFQEQVAGHIQGRAGGQAFLQQWREDHLN